MAGFQCLNLLTVQPGSMEAGLLCNFFFKTLLSLIITIKSILHVLDSPFASAEKACSLHVVIEASHGQGLADGNGTCLGNDVSRETVGSDSNVICLNGSHGGSH
jgi:hypothetical protein